MENQTPNSNQNPVAVGGVKPVSSGASQYPNFYSSSQPANSQSTFSPSSPSSPSSQYQTTFKPPTPPSYANSPKSGGGKGILIAIILLLFILVAGGIFYKVIYPKLNSQNTVKTPVVTKTDTPADQQPSDYQVNPIDITAKPVATSTKPIATTTVKTPVVASTTPAAPVVFYVDTVNAQHQYKDGIHTFTGTITVPSSCYLLDTKVGVAKNNPSAARIAFTTKNSKDCTDQTFTDRTFRISLKGASDIKFDATINNKVTVLNSTELAPVENIDQKEVMKG